MTAQQVISSVSGDDRVRTQATKAGSFRPTLGSIGAIFVVGLWLFPVYWIGLTSLKPIKEINSAVPTFIFTPTGELLGAIHQVRFCPRADEQPGDHDRE